MRNLLWLLMLLGFTALPAAGAPVADEIVLGSDTWHDLTREDGSGMYFDLIRAVFEPSGVKVTFRIVPYTRSVALVKAKKTDGWVASFRHEQPFPLYPKWHFDVNRQVAVGLKDGPVKYTGVGSLRGRKVAWLRDFNLDRYISVPMDFEEIDDINGAFPMLTAGRIDYFLGAESDVKDAMALKNIDPGRYRLDFILNLELLVAFADTDRGRYFRDLWDQRMETLHKDPAFLAIYQRYGYPVPPFD